MTIKEAMSAPSRQRRASRMGSKGRRLEDRRGEYQIAFREPERPGHEILEHERAADDTAPGEGVAEKGGQQPTGDDNLDMALWHPGRVRTGIGAPQVHLSIPRPRPKGGLHAQWSP